MGANDEIIITNQEFNKYFLPPSANAGDLIRVAKFEVARELGQYADNLVGTIKSEYDQQVEVWTQACRTAITALKNAILKRDGKLREIKEDAARDAEIAAFILGLASAGALRFLGAYVQYSYLPEKFRKTVTTLKLSQTRFLDLVTETTEFSKEYAAALGGIVQDIGNRTVSLGLSLARPEVTQAEDSHVWVNNLELNFFGRLADDTKKVSGTLAGLKHWVCANPEKGDSFGAQWAVRCENDETKGRSMVLAHFNRVRERLAKEWDFYGKTPVTAGLTTLENVFERGLWAGYILTHAPDKVWFESSNGRFRAPINRGRALEDEIIDRLKRLNVVVGETAGGRAEQQERDVNGNEPTPNVHVSGKLDEVSEIAGLKTWARSYLGNVKTESETFYFPPARPRDLQTLQ